MPLFYTENGFMNAAKKGDLETLKKYLATDKAAAMLKARDDENGFTAFHYAVARDHKDAAELLATFGADIQASTSNNRNALHLAAALKQPDMLEMLINMGLKPKEKLTDSNDSPLAIAAQKNKVDHMRLLLDAGADTTDRKALIYAFRYSQNDAVSTLIEYGFDLHQTDDYYHNTPLHMVANNGNMQLLSLVLKHGGVGLDAKNKDGDTALHLAAYSGYAMIVEALIKAGASLDIDNNEGLSAADVALKRDKAPVAKIIQQKQREQTDTVEKQSLYAIPAATDDTGADRETWLRLGEDKIAHIGVYPALERKLTEIFNFTTQERLTISENLRTGVENTLPPQAFDTLPESAVDTAYNAFAKQGGTAERNRVLKKKSLGAKPAAK